MQRALRFWSTWPLALRLARRELRGGLKGFRVFLACLTLGVGAIAAVGTVSSSMTEGLKNSGRTLLGGDLDVRMEQRALGPEPLAWMAERGTVSQAAHLRAMARDTDPEGRRALVELRAVDNAYPLYGAPTLNPDIPIGEVLEQRDGDWGAAVESSVLNRLDLALGDRMQIGDETYELRAVLEQEPDRAAQAFIFGPSTLVAIESLQGTGLLLPGALMHYHYRIALPPGTSAEAVTKALDQAFPATGWRIRDTSNAAQGTRQFLDRLTMFLTLVGLASLMIGGLGVANAVRGYLDSKTATIATLKCIGAPRHLVFQVYLVQILLIALVGIALGLALGALAPYLAVGAIGTRFGWQAALGLYPGPLALAAVFGLLVTLAFALWPLARANEVPAAALFRSQVAPEAGRPRAGTLIAVGLVALALIGLAVITAALPWLAARFVAGAAAALLLFAVAGHAIKALARRLPRPKSTTARLAVSNLHRPGATTVAVVQALGLGLTILVAIALIEGNLGRQVRDEMVREAPFAYFIDIQPDQVAAFESTVAAVPGAGKIERVPMLRGRISAVGDTPVSELSVPDDVEWVFRGDRGLTWSRDAPSDVELTLGEWWAPDYAGKPLVSLDADVGEALNLGIGDRLTINILGRDVEVTIANLRRINWADLGINFVMIFSPGLLESAPQTHIATVKAEEAAEDAIERAVTDNFANVSAIRVKQALAAVAELIGQIATAVRLTASVALLTGVFVLAGTVAAGHRRRVYDAVILKVLGATRGVLARAFLFEYGILGLVSAALAILFGTLAASAICIYIFEIPFAFLPERVIPAALLALALCLGVGFAGTWRVLAQKAAPHLRNE